MHACLQQGGTDLQRVRELLKFYVCKIVAEQEKRYHITQAEVVRSLHSESDLKRVLPKKEDQRKSVVINLNETLSLKAVDARQAYRLYEKITKRNITTDVPRDLSKQHIYVVTTQDEVYEVIASAAEEENIDDLLDDFLYQDELEYFQRKQHYILAV